MAWEAPAVATDWQPPVRAVTPAGWWQRVGAAIIDGLVVAVVAVVLTGIIAAAVDITDDAVTVIAAGVAVVVGGVYSCALLSRDGARNGQTWGKQAVGIRVVRMDGAPAEAGFTFVREVLVKTLLFGYVFGFLLYIPTIVNYLWPLWDPEGRALHDKIVRSRVVRV